MNFIFWYSAVGFLITGILWLQFLTQAAWVTSRVSLLICAYLAVGAIYYLTYSPNMTLLIVGGVFLAVNLIPGIFLINIEFERHQGTQIFQTQITERKALVEKHIAENKPLTGDDLWTYMGYITNFQLNVESADAPELKELAGEWRLLLSKKLLDLNARLVHEISDGDSTQREETPVLTHIISDKTLLPLVKTLVEYGADTEAKDRNGDTPLHALIRFGTSTFTVEQLEYFLGCGFDSYAKNANGLDVLAVLKQDAKDYPELLAPYIKAVEDTRKNPPKPGVCVSV